MKIAIFNDYQLPIPAVKGGSVPNLIGMLLDENEKRGDLDITVYSTYHEKAVEESKKYKKAKFVFSKEARRIKFFTNLKFVVMTKLRLPFKMANVPMPRSAKKHFVKQKYDLVYIAGYIRGVNEIVKYSNAPVIYHHHVVTDILNEKTIYGKKIFEECRGIFFVSKYAQDFAKTGISEYDNKMSVLLNAIDTSRFNCNDKDEIKKKIRKKLGFGQNDTIILFSGRMVKHKGCLEVIRAFNDAKFDSSVKLVAMGGATFGSKKITPYIQKCFDEAKTNSNITFLGYVPYSEIHEYYIAADISTLPSRWNEAAGLVGIESMAAGLPVITTDRAGIGEYVAEGCKIVVPDDDNIVAGFSEAMKTLVNSPEMRKEMAKIGEERVKIFSKESYYDRFVNIMKEQLK